MTFSTVHHRCFFPHKKLQSVFDDGDLPLSISYYSIIGYTVSNAARINVCIKKERPIITAVAVSSLALALDYGYLNVNLSSQIC